MIFPLLWTLKRPGWMIPVFFLLPAQLSVSGQHDWHESGSAALGGAFVTREGYSCAGWNQACLGAIEQHSLSLQHSRPYLLKELGQSSLSGQFTTGNGALGLYLSSHGIKGLRQSSFWLSYGMKLHPNVAAGMGIHLWNSSMAEHLFHASGISFAMGIRARINPQWVLGAHIKHPASWNSRAPAYTHTSMSLATGFSYTFLKSAIIYSEIHIIPPRGISLVEAIEWPLGKGFIMSAGFSSKPISLCWGISLSHSHWRLQFSFQYRSHSGTVPLSTLSHVW